MGGRATEGKQESERIYSDERLSQSLSKSFNVFDGRAKSFPSRVTRGDAARVPRGTQTARSKRVVGRVPAAFHAPSASSLQDMAFESYQR